MEKSNSKSKDFAQEIVREFKQLVGDRGNFEAQWQEIAARILPMHSGSFTSHGLGSQGEKRTEELFDSTAANSLNKFSAILDSLLTPRNQTWHRLMVSDKTLGKNRAVRLWFEDVNRILFKMRYAPKANFASQNQQNYKSLGAYGSGAMFIDQLTGYNERGLRYRNIHLSECYFVENHQGLIDQVYRHFPFTARQAIQKWGDKCPANIQSAVKDKPNQLFFFLHRVKPNENIDPTRKDYMGMPFSGCYVTMENPEVIEEGGFTSFPYAISRYEQAPGEIYGRSPAMDVLPAIKTLNEEKKTVLKQGHRATDPIYLMHDDGIMDAFSAIPGSMVSGGVSADGRPLVHTLPVGNIAIGKDLMDDERETINDAFLVKLFQIMVDSPAMTATEVMERSKEKGILLAPTVGRQQSEYLGPMIERELDILSIQQIIPAMPEALLEAAGEYRIEYDSPLSRAQRAEEASGLMRAVEMALNTINVTQNPEPLDHFDWDVIMPAISEIQGVPAHWMRSVEQIQAIRQGRQQQAETQEMIQAGPSLAAMTKATATKKKAA